MPKSMLFSVEKSVFPQNDFKIFRSFCFLNLFSVWNYLLENFSLARIASIENAELKKWILKHSLKFIFQKLPQICPSGFDYIFKTMGPVPLQKTLLQELLLVIHFKPFPHFGLAAPMDVPYTYMSECVNS